MTLDLAGGRFPSDSFGENAAWWHIALMSLNLLKLFQKHTLPKTFQRSRIKTLNRYFLRIAAKVFERGRQIFVKFQKNEFFKTILQSFKKKLRIIQVSLTGEDPPIPL